MQVEFATQRLKRLFTDHKLAAKQLGADVARRYVGRIELLYALPTFDEVRTAPGLRCHLLEPKERGYWALNVTGRWRLTVQPLREGHAVSIEDLTHHYGD